MAGESILVVDDETVVREVIKHHLELEGYQVITAGDGHSALSLVNNHEPHLIILDILLPDIDGIEVCRIIRKTSNVPIIFLSAKGQLTDIVLGLGVGGDDYITKPFNVVELLARVKANLRRTSLQQIEIDPPQNTISYPGLEIDLAGRTVRANDRLINLTYKEFELLVLLAQNPNQVFTYAQLLESVWDYKDNSDYRTVIVHINRLRNKIEPTPSQPRYIITVRGIGYKFSSPNP